MAEEIKTPKLLHVFGQGSWHDDIKIVGNREAFTRLIQMLQGVLKSRADRVSDDTFWVNDGEGYGVHIELHEGGWDSPFWVNAETPYYEEYANGGRSRPPEIPKK